MVTVLSLLLYAMVLFLSGILPLIGEHKTSFNQSILVEYTIDLMWHPFSTAKAMIIDGNPLFIIGMIAATGVIVYMIVKMFSKKAYENVGENYGVQGSARFAKNKELFIDEQLWHLESNQLNSIIVNGFKKELNGGERYE